MIVSGNKLTMEWCNMDVSCKPAFGLALLFALAAHGPASAADYLCGFSTSPVDAEYAGERIFSSDTVDPQPLACGLVEARREKLTAHHLLHRGSMTVSFDGDTRTLGEGYFQVKLFQVSHADGGACSEEMDVSLSGALLYRGAPLAGFGASSNGADSSSGIVQLTWATNANGQLYGQVDESVSISSFSGSTVFSCARLD